MRPSRNPANFPGEAVLNAIHDRLVGAVFRIDGTTPLKVFDSFPKTFDPAEWNFIEIAEGRVIDGEEVLGHYEVNVGIGVYSSYEGYLELMRELRDVHRLLTMPLDLEAQGFSEVSLGGDSTDAPFDKLQVEENVVIRRGVYRRRWKVADTTF